MFLNKKIINCNNKQELGQDHKKYFSIMWIHYCLQNLGITLILIINTNLFESHRMDWYVFKNKKSCTSGNSLIIIELNLASYFKLERDKNRKFFWDYFEDKTLFLVNFLLYVLHYFFQQVYIHEYHGKKYLDWLEIITYCVPKKLYLNVNLLKYWYNKKCSKFMLIKNKRKIELTWSNRQNRLRFPNSLLFYWKGYFFTNSLNNHRYIIFQFLQIQIKIEILWLLL